MDWQKFCQVFLVFELLIGYFVMVYSDFNGREAKQPPGFTGFVASCIIVILKGLILYGSGVLSSIVRR